MKAKRKGDIFPRKKLTLYVIYIIASIGIYFLKSLSRLLRGLKGGEELKITVKGNPKEIAALVLAVQEQREDSVNQVGVTINGKPIEKILQCETEKLPLPMKGGEKMDAIQIEVDSSGIDESIQKVEALSEKIKEARTLAGELASLLGELKIEL